MKYRYGYMPKAEQKHLTPKSAFLRKLERAQAKAAQPVSDGTITVEFTVADATLATLERCADLSNVSFLLRRQAN